MRHHLRANRAVPVVTALLATLGLSACSNDISLVTGATSTNEPTPVALGGATIEPQSAFDPFGNAASSTKGREILVNPTLADVLRTGELPEMSWGRDDAPVTIVKYASMTCPHCRKFQLEVFPQLKREMIDTGKVRFIIREFPIGKSSGTATLAMRCAPKEKYLALYEKYMTQQSSWVAQEVKTDAIYAVAAQVGMKRADFDSCLANRAMVNNLNWVKDRGRTLGVIGTPNFFVNNRLVKSTVGMKEIRELVDQAAARPAASKT